MLWFMLVLALAMAAAVVVSVQRQKRQRELEHSSALDKVKQLADEDVTLFGEQLQDLHIETLTTELNTAMRQDYQRALNSYETAKERLAKAREPEEVRTVTEALEDGRYAMACVLARQNGDPLPIRRPPCFFNPQHGPSTRDVDWAPAGGTSRHVPVCTADAERLEQGAEPDIRTVRDGFKSVPYWKAGRQYQPYAMGYYGAYADLLPMFFIMTMLNPLWMGGMVNDFDTGDVGSDVGADAGGDFGGDAGGDVAGDAGGDGGGWFDGGGGDGGGWFGGDGGGFDFGGF